MKSRPTVDCSKFLLRLPGKLGRQSYSRVDGTASAEVEDERSHCQPGIRQAICDNMLPLVDRQMIAK